MRKKSTTKARKYVWTAAEEEILLDEIGKNPTNMKACFIAASTQLPLRSASACSSHWYTSLIHKEDVVGKLTIGRSTVIKNRTRLNKETEQKNKTSIVITVWKAICEAIFG